MENLPMQKTTKLRSDIKEMMNTLFRHKRLVAAIFGGVALIVIVVTILQPSAYEANASIMVKIGREHLSTPEVGGTRSVMTLNQEQILNSEIQVINSHDLVAKVVAAIGIETLYPDIAKKAYEGSKAMELAVERFQKQLNVEGVKKSNVLRITFRHPEPKTAARAVNTLVELLKEKHLQVFSDPQSSFLEKQLAAYEQKLQQSEMSMEAFKQRHQVYSLEEQRTLLLQQRTELDTALKNSVNTIHELQRKVATLREKMRAIAGNKEMYTSSERDQIIVEAKSRLLALQLNEQELLKKYTEGSRLVVNARKEIQLVKDFLREQEEDISGKVRTSNSVYQGVEMDIIKSEAELNAQKAKTTALQQQLHHLDGQIQSLGLRENEFQTLKREQITNEKNYRTYADKYEEARISDDMNRLKLANLSIVQPAVEPTTPVNPKTISVAIGLLCGLAASLAAAFINECRLRDFSTPEKVEQYLGLPVLATISRKEG